MSERASSFERDPHDFYVEPAWAVETLAQRVQFLGKVHDPCCGMGTIPKVLNGTGADLVDRGYGFTVLDFLMDNTFQPNIVTNPPYGIAEQIIEHAFRLALDRVAVLVQVKFLASQRRHALFERAGADPALERVIMFSRRPSMPPGRMLAEHGEAIRGGGSIDFCWVVWRRHHRAQRP